MASLVGYTIWNMLLGRYPAAVVAPFALLTPPIGLVAAAVALGQVPNALELAGSALLVGGVAVGQVRRRRRREPDGQVASVGPVASLPVASVGPVASLPVGADAARRDASGDRGIAASDRGVDPIPAVRRRS
jgi:O-acetylserine/cysteine efflux transporter